MISQVYGGGGNLGGLFDRDFIELYNRGPELVDLDGWTVQYAPPTSGDWASTSLTGTMHPGTYYLIAEHAGDAGGPALPVPDAEGNIPINAISGRVALAASAVQLVGSCPAGCGIADLVGYGAASCAEGGHAAPTLNNTAAALRLGAGATDTGDNAADFTAGPPVPRNRRHGVATGHLRRRLPQADQEAP